MHRLAACLFVTGCALVPTACTPAPTAPSPTRSGAPTGRAAHLPPVPEHWGEKEVTFPSSSGTVHGTWLAPRIVASPRPAALIIAGSGPTDRNGNSATLPGEIGTLEAVARMLAADGVASLRYDKLGSGATGMGSLGPNGRFDFTTFTQQASAAMGFVERQPGVDKARLVVVGHSEGGMFAEMLAAGRIAGAPRVAGAVLLEPLSLRYLDLLTTQISGQADAAVARGVWTRPQADAYLADVGRIVAEVRAGRAPTRVPTEIQPLFLPGNLAFLRQADRVDPVALARLVPPSLRVLLTCSDADIQVACEDVRRVAAAMPDSRFVVLKGVSHVLKEDPSKDPARYAADLPFSADLQLDLRAFVSTLR